MYQKFVERKDAIDTYRHKETNELVYQTRRTETADEVFRRAFETVWQLRREPGTPVKTGEEASALRQPIVELQSLIAKYPDVAKSSLALGMAWFAIGKTEAARHQLGRAAELDSTNTIILKELGGVCLDQGDFAGAVEMGTRAVTIKPDDPELLGDLAVSQLLAGNVAKSKQTISHALSLEPGDAINRNIRVIIEHVVQGRRKRPKALEDMMTPQPKKTSLLPKLFGGGN